MQKLTKEEFEEITVGKPFNNLLLEKDYLITTILFLLKDFSDLYFKGGTALNKIFLNHARLSEDIDLTIVGDINPIKDKIEKTLKESSFFTSFAPGKHRDRFTRIIVGYQGFYGNEGQIFIDLSKKKSLQREPEKHPIPHFYAPHIPLFSFTTLAQQEMFAEKVRATIERNKPRDHLDLYHIITRGLPLDLKLAQAKCQESSSEFDVVRMFKRANRLKRRWDEDLGPLLVNKITFQEVMSTLAKHFNLKHEKASKKLLVSPKSPSDFLEEEKEKKKKLSFHT